MGSLRLDRDIKVGVDASPLIGLAPAPVLYFDGKLVIRSIMKTANVADLRNNFATIAAWIADGGTATIHKRGKPFAKLVPATGRASAHAQNRFCRRLRRIWGDRVFSGAEVAAMKASELEGEEG